MPNAIPERQPIGDLFAGAVLALADAYVIALAAPEGVNVVAQGDLIARYGVRYLGKPHVSIVPGLVAIDYGEMLTGDAAWEFVTKRSNLYPRAEVFGFRNDGRDEMTYVKNLDLVLPIDVLVYTEASATRPVASVSAIIAPPDAALPARLLNTLPRYDTIAAWREMTQPHE